jgi:hypothetical protein
MSVLLAPAASATAAALARSAPSPSPSGPSALQVTPGLTGFLVTFGIAVACVLLFLSLTRHLRKATYNARELGLPVEEPKRRGFAPPDDAQPDDAEPDGGQAPDGGRAPDADGPSGGDTGPSTAPDGR